jgi:predicted DNA repair protein MutK
MASSLLALIDDIASLLDDVSVLTKVAAKKTAGVLGDDLALNAQQVSGIQADRELPVVWAVAKGSVLNKLILVPAALAISQWLPWAVTPLLMAGGLFLCFEGFEKLAHRYLHSAQELQEAKEALHHALAQPDVTATAFEKDRIRGAVRTDFILSAEIIVISLGTVQGESFATQLGVLCSVAAMMTIFVYGLVAGIVKLDDAGLYLSQRPQPLSQRVGGWILVAAPWLMKFLSVAGTAAMFLVGGSILLHGLPVLGHGLEALLGQLSASAGWVIAALAELVAHGLAGLVAGGLALAVWSGARRLWPAKAATSAVPSGPQTPH